LWAAAALFAAFHFPYRRAMLPWTAFALAMGIGLGWLTEWAGSLWPAIWVHFCVNYFNLHDIAGDGAEEPAPLGRG
jgi:membrane protease YdiL (CAAX protease family)